MDVLSIAFATVSYACTFIRSQSEKEIRRKDMIAIGCDHGGYELKLEVIKHLKERCKGTNTG